MVTIQAKVAEVYQNKLLQTVRTFQEVFTNLYHIYIYIYIYMYDPDSFQESSVHSIDKKKSALSIMAFGQSR